MACQELSTLCSLVREGDVKAVQQWVQSWKDSQSPEPPRGPPAQPLYHLQLALQTAVGSNQPAVASKLISEGCEIDPACVTKAVSIPSFEVLAAFLDSGWDINQDLGHTGDALIIATGADKLSVVRWLLARGADPNAHRHGQRRTALECAAAGAAVPVVAALLAAGAHVRDRAALGIAAANGRADVARTLLDHGARVDEIPDHDELDARDRDVLGVGTALCDAARAGRTEAVAVLLARGADATVRDSMGRDALELATASGHDDCAEILAREV